MLDFEFDKTDEMCFITEATDEMEFIFERTTLATDPDGNTWILEGGFWNDNGIWIDSETWQD